MNYAQLLRFYGNQRAAAEAIGVSQATVCRWQTVTGGRIPLLRQQIIERVTRGKLKADPVPLPPKRPRRAEALADA